MRRRYGVDSGVARHVGTDSSAVGARELVPAFRRPVCRDRHRRTQPNAPHGPSRSRTRYESSCQPNRLPSPRRIPNPQQADTRCRTDLPLACSVYRFRSRRQCSERRSRRDATWHSPESCYHMVARANSPLGADQCRRLHVIGSDNRSQDSERPKADLVNEYRRLRKFMPDDMTSTGGDGGRFAKRPSETRPLGRGGRLGQRGSRPATVLRISAGWGGFGPREKGGGRAVPDKPATPA